MSYVERLKAWTPPLLVAVVLLLCAVAIAITLQQVATLSKDLANANNALASVAKHQTDRTPVADQFYKDMREDMDKLLARP